MSDSEWQWRRRYFRALELQFVDLLAVMVPTLSRDDQDMLLAKVESGEYGLALELLCSIVAGTSAPVPREAWTTIVRLQRTMGMPEGIWQDIRVSA